LPDEGEISRRIACIKVDFPLPTGPTIQVSFPAAALKKIYIFSRKQTTVRKLEARKRSGKAKVRVRVRAGERVFVRRERRKRNGKDIFWRVGLGLSTSLADGSEVVLLSSPIFSVSSNSMSSVMSITALDVKFTRSCTIESKIKLK
jgi:hypothetical protein